MSGMFFFWIWCTFSYEVINDINNRSVQNIFSGATAMFYSVVSNKDQ